MALHNGELLKECRVDSFMMKKRTLLLSGLFFIPYLFLYFLTANNVLFWDTVQFAGRHPSFYYETNFQNFLLPNEFDSGHPPTFGIYLAFLWKIFGKSIWLNHTAMLPFITMFVYQAVRLGEVVFPKSRRFAIFAVLLILSEASLLTQSILVSPDIWVMAFFLYAFNAVWQNKRWHILISVTLLSLLSMRAMMTAAALYMLLLLLHADNFKKKPLQTVFHHLIPFIPGIILSISFFTYHYIEKGWFGYHSNSVWAPGFESISTIGQFIKNLMILIWRIIDTGRVATIGIATFMALIWLMNYKKNQGKENFIQSRSLIFYSIILILITGVSLCFYAQLISHRYFMPFYASMAILALFLIKNSNLQHKTIYFVVMLLVQLSGHFWKYPDRISQGWDTTLSHLPYYEMRNDFISYIEQHKIPHDKVGAAFSMVGPVRYIEINNNMGQGFAYFEDEGLEYMLYSNTMNMMNKYLPELKAKWEVLKYEKRGYVEMILFKKK